MKSSRKGNVQLDVYTMSRRNTIRGKRKLALDGVLLCTLRARLSIRPYIYPDDGVCAITMFNSLFIRGGSTLTPPYESDFQHFLETASHRSKTEYGIGVDHK
ncbi:hypothetical protein MRX96_009345 [Rhipicephalus microplus]